MDIGNRIADVLGISGESFRYDKHGKWFHSIKAFPGVLFDSDGYYVIETEQDYTHNEFLTRTVDHIHIRNVEIWGGKVKGVIADLPDYTHFSQLQKEQIYPLLRKVAIKAEESSEDREGETIRIIRERSFILRDSKKVVEIKTLYENKCQICLTRIDAGGSRYYSEVHHIKPLGRPHEGSDVKSNMICVCPNHHAQLDLGGIELSLNTLLLKKHKIFGASVDYHNSRILKSKEGNP